MSTVTCNFCKTPLTHTFVDLGMSPLVNSFLRPEDLRNMEPFYPLHVYVCETCYLVQLPESTTPQELFGDYLYFSSYSETWLQHCKAYVDHIIERFGINTASQVVEIASNDGYLLQYFRQRGVPVLGVEPARNVAAVAQAAGIPTIVKFFGVQTATELLAEGKAADLIVGNNVLAHVPDLNDFVQGLKILLKTNGIVTVEFPHVLRLIAENQFDTIYHEHFSYLSLISVERVFAHNGLAVFDVLELPTHGGSLRVYARHAEDDSRPITAQVGMIREQELRASLHNMDTYASFATRPQTIKHGLLDLLIQLRGKGCSIVGYGAPGKATVLLNYCGIRSDLLDYTVDRSPHKQGRFVPGVRVPIHDPRKIRETRPDFVLILPWNLKDEIMEQLAFIRDWGGQFIVPIPQVRIYP